MSTLHSFAQALAALLPRGWAWPRQLGSVQQLTLRGVAACHAKFHEATIAAVLAWMPHLATTRLQEWLDATGLPDACASSASPELLRALMLLRLRGLQLPYDDSSPAALGVLQQLLDLLGVQGQLVYEAVFRVERNGIDDALGRSGVLFLDFGAYCTQFGVAENGIDDFLVSCSPSEELLLCLLRRYTPARFDIVVRVKAFNHPL